MQLVQTLQFLFSLMQHLSQPRSLSTHLFIAPIVISGTKFCFRCSNCNYTPSTNGNATHSDAPLLQKSVLFSSKQKIYFNFIRFIFVRKLVCLLMKIPSPSSLVPFGFPSSEILTDFLRLSSSKGVYVCESA